MRTNRDAYNAYMRQYMKDRRASRRQAVMDMRGAVCVRCGSTEALEFDHVDPGTKEFNVSDPALMDGPMGLIIAEAAKCQVLCKPCHMKRTSEQQSRQVHGTHWSYQKYKCRCDDCIAAFKLKNKEYKERYRQRKQNADGL